MTSKIPFASDKSLLTESSPQGLIRLSFNENPYGPSSNVAEAIQHDFTRLNRYADSVAAQRVAEQIATYEHLPVEQVVLGEILGLLGLYLGSQGGPGGEFIYSTPGYLAFIDATARVGGIGVPVPLNARYQNNLTALRVKVNERTRAIYLVNPHNPTGTVNNDKEFKRFLGEISQHVVAIVDEAYLEYTADFPSRSAVSLVGDGANVLVFRTFDKIHALAALPIGYVLAPRALADALRKQGAGDADSRPSEHHRCLSNSLSSSLHLSGILQGCTFVFFNAGVPQPKTRSRAP